jgi:hypothetical protein
MKCKKCGAVFEQGFGGAVFAPHVGPYHYFKCPACKKSGWFNFYKSVEDPVNYPKPETPQEPERLLTEEELEAKRIEESKYEH